MPDSTVSIGADETRGRSFLQLWLVLTYSLVGLAIGAGNAGLLDTHRVHQLVGYFVFVAVVTIALASRARVHPRAPDGLSFLLIAYPAVELASAAANGQLSGSPAGLAQVSAVMVGPLAAWHVRRSSHSRLELAKCVLGGLAIVVWGSLIAALLDQASFTESVGRLGGLTAMPRLLGLTTHPNVIGMTGWLFAITVLVVMRGLRRLVNFSAGALCVVLSQERAALLALLVGLLLYAVSQIRSAGLRIVAWCASLVIGVLGFVGFATSAETVHELGGYQTLGSRQDVWNFVVSHWWDSPVTGWGPLGIYQRASGTTGLTESFFHAHNQLLNAWAVGGASLFVITAAILIAAARLALTSRREDGPLGPMAMSGILVLMAVESPLHTGLAPYLTLETLIGWFAIALATSHAPGIQEK